MKKSKILSLVSLGLIVVLALGLFAGCNSNSGSTGTSTPTSTKTPAPTSATGGGTNTGNTAPEGMTAFDKRVHITVPIYDRSEEGFPDVTNNYWTQWIQKEFGDKYNVDVEYVGIPRGDVLTKYSLLIAAGDTPTILMEYDYPKVAQWADEGAMQVIDLDEFKSVAPNFYQAMVDNNQLGYTDINNETYFVLTERPYYNTTYTYVTFVRMDWLRQIGMDQVPQSYAEHTRAMDAIKAAGLCDNPIGLAIPSTAYVGNFFYRDFPVDEAEWAQHSTLATPSFTWYPTEKYLKRLNTEYNKGWISPEFYLEGQSVTSTSSAQMQTDFVNGNLYRFGGYMSANVDWLNAFYENNPNAELALESVYCNVEPSIVDQPSIRADNPFGMIVGFSSKATKDELKAAWMLMEWMIDPEVLFTLENGIEGKTYVIGDDGLPKVDTTYKGEGMLNRNMNLDITCLVHANKKVGTIEETIALTSPQGLPQDFTQAITDNYYVLKEIADQGWAYSDPVFAVTINTESEYNATLLSLYKEYFVQLVICDTNDFDKLYADYSKTFLSQGYQKIIDERLAAFNDGKTTKLPDISR